MNIHQFNVSYLEQQDRLLLRLNTSTAEEFRFWLTRRLTLRLVPALQEIVGRMESSQPHTVAPDPVSKHILTELKREAFLQQADFQTPYTEQAEQWPLGDVPMLVTDVQLNIQHAGLQITLMEKEASSTSVKTCQLHLPTSQLHGLIHLIGQAAGRAEWHGQDAQNSAPPLQADTPPATGYRH